MVSTRVFSQWALGALVWLFLIRNFCRSIGFDHGVGHPLLLLSGAKAPNCRKNKAFNDLGHYAEWPKVADAVIKAPP
jgi:hypothetical protein